MALKGVNYYSENQAEAAMAVVAQWLSKDPDLKVVYHDGTAVDADLFRKIIRVPRLACSGGLNEETLWLTRHRQMHEGGHIAHTKLAKKDYPPPGALFECWNAIEDRRMERVQSDEHPGAEAAHDFARHYYNKKIAQDVADGNVDAPLWEALVAMAFQSEGVPPKWRLSEKAQKYFDAAYDKFSEWKGLKDAFGSLMLATEVYNLLKDVHEQEQQEQDPDEGPGEQGPQGEEQDGEPQESQGGEGEPQQGGRDDFDDEPSEPSDDDEEGEEKKGSGSGEEDDDEDGEESEGSGSGDDDEDGEEPEGPGSGEEEDEDEDGNESEGSGSGDDEEGDDGEESEGSGSGEEDDDGEESEGPGSGEEEEDDENDESEGSGSGEEDDEDGGESEGSESESGDDGEASESGGPEKESEEGSDNHEPDDSGPKGGEGAEDDGETEEERDERLAKELDDEADGRELHKYADEDIEKALSELDPKDVEYLSRKDLDEHQVIEGDEADMEGFKAEREKVAAAVAAMVRAMEQALRAKARCRRLPAQRRGRIDMTRLTHIAKNLSKEVFYRTRKGERLETAVEIIIDESGSMGGMKRDAVQSVAIAVGESLAQLNIPFEITGTRTKYGGGNPNIPPLNGFDRTNPLVFNHYKTFGQAWQRVKHAIVRTGSRHHNVDGEAVEWAARRLASRPEDRKVVLVLSDGLPEAGQGNDTKMGQNIVRTCERARRSGIEVYGFGICTRDPERYYGKESFIHLPVGEIDLEFARSFVEILMQGRMSVRRPA